MSDRNAFERQLAETPDDDTTRLVYADWLDENQCPEEVASQRLLATGQYAEVSDTYCLEWRSWEDVRNASYGELIRNFMDVWIHANWPDCDGDPNGDWSWGEWSDAAAEWLTGPDWTPEETRTECHIRSRIPPRDAKPGLLDWIRTELRVNRPDFDEAKSIAVELIEGWQNWPNSDGQWHERMYGYPEPEDEDEEDEDEDEEDEMEDDED